ncbi:MAG: hypothetical protein SWK76_06550 [Actinomycetota bacterium]|nr:hypothetical protein [Actinomycetota bacterium]
MWKAEHLIAGIKVEISSKAGDASGFLPTRMGHFAPRSHTSHPDIVIALNHDEVVQADPLKHFFPSKFVLTSRGDELLFEGINGKKRLLAVINPREARGEMAVPSLRGPWRVVEEEEAVREAVQAFMLACLQLRLLDEGGTLLHAAGVVIEGEAYAFVGHTRAGKTTLVRSFHSSEVLGDDLVAVRELADRQRLFGTPWPGREGGKVAYGGLPLRAVFILHRELPPGLRYMSAAEAVAELAVDAPRLGHKGEESKLLENISRLADAVPIFKLSLRLEDDVAAWLKDFSLEGGKGP